MESFYAEYSKLIGYSMFIRLRPGVETKIVLTPTPGVLFFRVCEKNYAINLVMPIRSLEDVVNQQEENWVFIKIPAEERPDHEVLMKKEIGYQISRLQCNECMSVLIDNIERSYPLPSTNWEILSELWNCHPSHEPTYSLEFKKQRCYISIFYYHFLLQNLDCNVVIKDSIAFCGGCSKEIGYVGDNLVLYRHRVFFNEKESFNGLLEQAFIERINESSRDVHLGDLFIRLLKWDNFSYVKNKFVKSMKVIYKKEHRKGLKIPDEDFNNLHSSLKKYHKKLPESIKKFKDWNVSIIIFNDD